MRKLKKIKDWRVERRKEERRKDLKKKTIFIYKRISIFKTEIKGDSSTLEKKKNEKKNFSNKNMKSKLPALFGIEKG